MGLTHINAYRKIPGVNVVAVCDAVRQPVNGVLAGVSGNVAGSDTVELGPSVRAYTKIEDLLADAEVELVDLCVPTPMHVPQTIASLQAGKHVICEKPLARTSASRARSSRPPPRQRRSSCRPCACGSGRAGPG